MSSLAPPGCTCRLVSPRCAECVAQALMWHSGSARDRGEQWARRVAGMVGTAVDWPPYEGRAASIARRQVAHLSSDDRIADALARECHAFAARTWAKLRAASR